MSLPSDLLYNRVIGSSDAAEFLGISRWTLQRLGPDGPPRVRLSERRVGYRVADLQSWLAKRAETSRERE